MPIDKRPLVRIEPYTVLQERHDVLFTDGTTLALHRVEHDGAVSHYLRCIVHDEVHAIVFDVRDLVPALKADLPVALDNDKQGLVGFSIRLAFTGRDHFRAAVFVKRKALGLVEIEPVQRPLFIAATGYVDFMPDSPSDRRFWPVSLAS